MPVSKPDSTRIVLSGIEGDRFMDTAFNFANSRYVLMSFFYAEAKGQPWLEARRKKYPGHKLILDSGAHSFRSAGYCEKWPDLAWFDDYAIRYRDWIIKNREHIDFAVNLDVDTPCGMSNMLRWDNEVFRPLERAGIPICYVWHQNYGFDYWLQMCREHEYVGLPGHLPEPEYHKLMKPAIANGCRVHGFAATKSFILGKVPLATSDSISWKSGEMYGQTFVFEGGRLRVFDKSQKEERVKYKARWVSLGVDWDALEQDKAEAVTQVNAIAWSDYQDHVTNMTRKLAYWNKTSAAVDDLITNANGIANLTKEQIHDFYDKHKCPLRHSSDDEARTELAEIRAFLARDTAVVFGMEDSRIDFWVERLKAEPENPTRTEKEAVIRQALYAYFYKIQAAEAAGRMTAESTTPVKEILDRDEPSREYPGVDADLPLYDKGLFGVADAPSLALPAPETTQDQPIEGAAATPVEPPSTPVSEQSEAAVDPANIVPDIAFTAGIKDTILRAKVRYGVELIFEQNKLRSEATTLKAMRREVRRQRELGQRIAALSTEITAISDAAGDPWADRMRAAGEAAFDAWKAARDPAKATAKAVEDKERKLTPQARLLVERPDIASAIGKLGGAPKGNQNARKHGLYSPRLPPLACDNCPHIQVCPQYRAGHVCAYLNEFSGGGPADPLVTLEAAMQSESVRLRRAMLFETFEGGIASKEVTRMTAQVAKLAKMIHDIHEARAGRVANPAARVALPTTAATPVEKKEEGLLARLFGAAINTTKNAEGVYTPEAPADKPNA